MAASPYEAIATGTSHHSVGHSSAASVAAVNATAATDQ